MNQITVNQAISRYNCQWHNPAHQLMVGEPLIEIRGCQFTVEVNYVRLA